jgi:queuosine precursor transporter
VSVRGIIAICAYLAAQLVSNVASLKIVMVLGLSMDAGTLIYPFTFTLRDVVHKSIGLRGVRALVVIAAAANLLLAGVLWVVAQIPGDPRVGPQTEFAIVLAPVWRIVVASVIAELISELLDTEVYRYWARWMGSRWQWSRVVASNIISEPVDSLLFAWLAFGGKYDNTVVWGIVLSNIGLKYAMTVVGWPLIYTVPEGPGDGGHDH